MPFKVDKIQKLIEGLAKEMPGILAVGITENETGMVIAGTIVGPNFSLDQAGAYFTEAYQKSSKAVDIVGGGLMKEILITAQDQIHMMITLKDGKYHVGVCVRSDAQLGMIRVICKNFQNEIEKYLD